jgi:hypothetical protein
MRINAYVPPEKCVPHGNWSCTCCKRMHGYPIEFLVTSLGVQNMYKPDGNQAKIVTALRASGCSVEIISSPVGRAGIPDLLVGRKGVNYLLEIKMPNKIGTLSSKQNLSDSQVRWHLAWKGRTVRIVTTTEEAFEAVGVGK